MNLLAPPPPPTAETHTQVIIFAPKGLEYDINLKILLITVFNSILTNITMHFL